MPNIAVDDRTHKEAKTLSTTYEITLGELIQHSVVYFKKTGINPSQAENESPHKVLKELEKRIGQVVAYIKTHEQEKLNPLLEHLIILSRQLDEALQKLPQAERFEAVVKSINKHNELLIDSHKKQVAALQQYQQKINQENQTTLNNVLTALNTLTKSFNNLQAEQQAIKDTIEAKLSKKVFG